MGVWTVRSWVQVSGDSVILGQILLPGGCGFRNRYLHIRYSRRYRIKTIMARSLDVRAGEMIPEVGRLGLGAPRKRVPKCLKGPKTTYTTIEIAEKQSKISKKGPFSLYIGPPGSHPGNGIDGARRGRSLPVPPPPHPRFLQPCLMLSYIAHTTARYHAFTVT